jgi:hypothetical protein
MQDLIVLGIIPGTNIQVGFLGWLIIASLIILTARIIRRFRRVSAMKLLISYLSQMYALKR